MCHHGRLSRFADHRRGQGVREDDRPGPRRGEEGLPQLLRRDEGRLRYGLHRGQPHRRLDHLRKVPGARGGDHGGGRGGGQEGLRDVVQGSGRGACGLLREVPRAAEGQEDVLRGDGHRQRRNGPRGRGLRGRLPDRTPSRTRGSHWACGRSSPHTTPRWHRPSRTPSRPWSQETPWS